MHTQYFFLKNLNLLLTSKIGFGMMYIVRDNKVTIIKIIVKRLLSCPITLTSAGKGSFSIGCSAPMPFFP